MLVNNKYLTTAAKILAKRKLLNLFREKMNLSNLVKHLNENVIIVDFSFIDY